MTQKRIVIVGGGFAGLEAARTLPRSAQVTLIDPTAEFEWQPNLHELVSGLKRSTALRLPRQPLLERWGHRFVQDTVDGVDRRARQVKLRSGDRIGYDALIVGVGGRSVAAGRQPLSAHSTPLRTVAHGEDIANRLDALKQAGAPFDVVVMGGGFIGVEVIGELLRLREEVPIQLTLVEGSNRLMRGYPDKIDRSLQGWMQREGVDLRLNARVSATMPNAVLLESGESLPSDLTIEALGIAPQPLLAEMELALPGSWATVSQTLQSTVDARIFVVGDSARVSGRPVGKQAYQALEMGATAAKNAMRLLSGRRLRRFRPRPDLYVVTFGDRATYFIAQGVVIENRLLSTLREAIFQRGMLAFDLPSGVTAWERLGERLLDPLRLRLLPALSRT